MLVSDWKPYGAQRMSFIDTLRKEQENYGKSNDMRIDHASVVTLAILNCIFVKSLSASSSLAFEWISTYISIVSNI